MDAAIMNVSTPRLSRLLDLWTSIHDLSRRCSGVRVYTARPGALITAGAGIILTLAACNRPDRHRLYVIPLAGQERTRTADIAGGLEAQPLPYVYYPPMRQVPANPHVIEALRFTGPWPETKWITGECINEAVRRGVPASEILPDLLADTWITLYPDPAQPTRLLAVAWSERP